MPLTIPPNADFTASDTTQAQFKARLETLLTELRTNAAALADVRGQKNRIVNGGFTVNQAGVTSAADAAYHLDQWYALCDGGSVTVTQQANQENGSPASLRLTQPDVTAKRIGTAQPLESLACRDLRGAALTLSARVRCSASQAIRWAVLEHTGTADSITRDVVNNWASGAFTPSNFFIAGVNVLGTGSVTPAANTWAGITSSGLVAGAGMNNLIVLFWTEGTLAQNVTLDIGRVQLEAGAIATPYEHRAPATELAMCQRYWAQTYQQGVAPGTVTDVGRCALFSFANGAVLAKLWVPFPVAMRATPTVTVFNPATGSSGFVRRGGTNTAAATIEDVHAGSVLIGTNDTTSTNGMSFHYTATARL